MPPSAPSSGHTQSHRSRTPVPAPRAPSWPPCHRSWHHPQLAATGFKRAVKECCIFGRSKHIKITGGRETFGFPALPKYFLWARSYPFPEYSWAYWLNIVTSQHSSPLCRQNNISSHHSQLGRMNFCYRLCYFTTCEGLSLHSWHVSSVCQLQLCSLMKCISH